MKSMRSLYKKLFHYVPDKRILAYFSMALSAAAVCSYMGAYWFLWQSIVSILVIPVYEKAMYDAIIVVILMILRGILNIASATCSHYLGFRLETNLRKNGLHKLLDASSSFFDHNSSGEIRKIIDDNAAETHKAVAHLIPDNVTAVMTPVLMFVLMFAIDYRLGILLILTTVIGVLQYRKMSGGTEFLSGYSAALQKMSAATVEYVRGMQIIKIFGVTVQYYKTLINSIKEYKQYVYQYSLSCKNPYVGFQVLFNVFYAFAVPAAVVFISYGEPAMLILAKIVFFAVFSGAVFTSFTSIMFTGQDNFGAQNTLNQLDELTTSMDQAKLPHGNEETFQDFNIEFRHVDFKYDDNFVLKDFSLTLHQNKTYALIGSSGGGKSTIAKLISGFYPVDGGEILIGGKNIQSYSEKALIQNIAFVFQRSQLLKTSIYENVRIGNPQATRQQIIIDRQTWEKVQALQKGTRRKKPTVTQEPSVFSGLLKCPECGGNLNFHFNQNNHDIKFFSCQNHNSGYRKCSKTHYIRLDFLEQVVLYEVKRLACFASEYENDFIKAMIGRSAKVAENTALRKQRELDALTARDRELDMLFERLYEDNVAGKIDDARFAKMSKRYEQEQGENAKKIKALRLELKKDESKRMDIDDFLETVRRYTDATTITKRMVAELIDHIEVYHAEKQDGVTNQRVVIYYNCIGAFDVPDRRKIPEADIIMETRKGVALSYAPEQVAV